MNILRRTEQFMHWFDRQKDTATKARIAARLKQATVGNFGDHKGVGEGVMEMRIHAGAGIRIYYAQAKNTVYVLLIGGDKSSQDADIQKAKCLWREIQEVSNEESSRT